jgi:hypothetical protein
MRVLREKVDEWRMVLDWEAAVEEDEEMTGPSV